MVASGLPRIRALDPIVVSQIAAGEVVERPASVLRELLDNALDAGATRIEVEVEQGGIERICVADDGCGIAGDDLPLALASHATSKLSSANDLETIATMGFRGEALASIASIAQVELRSVPRGSGAGAIIRSHGGRVDKIEPWLGTSGTRVEVKHLFYNAPVRRRFLKSPAAEMAHFNEVLTRFALAIGALPAEIRPHIILRQGRKTLMDLPGSLEAMDRVERLFGPEVAHQLHAIDRSRDGMRLRGLVADPACDRGTARMQYLFVNGRHVKDRSLQHAITEAYRGLMMVGRHPVAFLFLDVPPGEVDVNVHPAKSEVRFHQPQAIHQLIFGAIKDRLRREELVPPLRPATEFRFDPPAPVQLSLPMPPPPVAPRSIRDQHSHEAGGAESSPTVHDSWPIERPRQDTPNIAPPRNDSQGNPNVAAPQVFQELTAASSGDSPRMLQIYDSYLVVESSDGLMVIDQHALHERILFEQIKKRLTVGAIPAQRLLLPEVVELTGEQRALIEEWSEALRELGMEVEAMGATAMAITAYPGILGQRSPGQLLMQVVDHLVKRQRPPSREALLHDIMSLMACHSAVRAREPLTQEQMAALLEQRHLAQDTHHCPHGRPTALVFSKHDLERQFGRT